MSPRLLVFRNAVPFLTGFIGVLVVSVVVGVALVAMHEPAPTNPQPAPPRASSPSEAQLLAVLTQRWERLKTLEEEANRLQSETILLLNARSQAERKVFEERDRQVTRENPYLTTPLVHEAIHNRIRGKQKEYFDEGVADAARAESRNIAQQLSQVTPEQEAGIQDAYFQHLKDFETWRADLLYYTEEEAIAGMKRYAEDIEARLDRVLSGPQLEEWRSKMGNTARGLYENMVVQARLTKEREAKTAAEKAPEKH